MGCVQGKRTEADSVNKHINKELRDGKRQIDREIKLLLLGTGDSGKSTVAKQMKILHMNGFTEQELLVFKPVIHNNTIYSIKMLISACEQWGYPLEGPNQKIAESFNEVNAMRSELTIQMGEDVSILWKDGSIRRAFSRNNELQIPGVAEYCFENVKRLAQPDYIPSKEDALRCRARTTGIIETIFGVDRFTFRLVDVGGQRSERKKWIHCFEDVTAIIFCVALNEYDLKLFEDETVNRMKESLELFDEICNSNWFERTSMILFLNKSDLFKEKIKKVDLRTWFPEYNGGADYDSGWKFIRDKFLALNKAPGKKHIYSHITCATDTENVRIVFGACKDIILSGNLENAGFT